MVEPTNSRWRDDPPLFTPFDGPVFRRVLLQGKMRPRSMIIIDVASEDMLQLAFSQDDHVIQAFPTYGTDNPLGIGILPG